MTTLIDKRPDDMTNQRSARSRSSRMVWMSSRGEPPATATITWGVDDHDTTIVDLTGELCTATAHRVRKLVEEVAEATPADVAIDMSEVTFIDSRGLALLLLMRTRLAERGLRCRLVNLSPVVRRLVDIVGFS